jgi:hypothetical protein
LIHTFFGISLPVLVVVRRVLIGEPRERLAVGVLPLARSLAQCRRAPGVDGGGERVAEVCGLHCVELDRHVGVAGPAVRRVFLRPDRQAERAISSAVTARRSTASIVTPRSSASRRMRRSIASSARAPLES